MLVDQLHEPEAQLSLYVNGFSFVTKLIFNYCHITEVIINYTFVEKQPLKNLSIILYDFF